MTNTITAYKLDIRYFAEAYESLMRMERHGTTFHMNDSPLNVLRTYKCLSDKLGVKLMNDHFLARVEEIVEQDVARKTAIAREVFGGRRQELFGTK